MSYPRWFVWRADLAKGHTTLFSSKEAAFNWADSVISIPGEWMRIEGGWGKTVEEWIFMPDGAKRAPVDPIRIFKQEVRRS